MNDNQIPGQQISQHFNSKSALPLEARIEILQKSLPPDKHTQWSELKARLDKEATRLTEKQIQERPAKFKAAYTAEEARLIQSAINSRMPPPPQNVVEHNARIAATALVSQKENLDRKRLQTRSQELQYDFLKKQQPDHPLVKSIREAQQPTQQLTHSFNLSAARQGGAER